MRFTLGILALMLVVSACMKSETPEESTTSKWPFDQARNTATVSSRQVINEGLPVLSVVHYSDDHSWAFSCGTTNRAEDMMLVSMSQVIDGDSTLIAIADLPPGWSAHRSSKQDSWIRVEDEPIGE